MNRSLKILMARGLESPGAIMYAESCVLPLLGITYTFCTHKKYHISHITHNTLTLLGKTELTKHGIDMPLHTIHTEILGNFYMNTFNCYHRIWTNLSNSKILLHITCLYSLSTSIRQDFSFTRKLHKSQLACHFPHSCGYTGNTLQL